MKKNLIMLTLLFIAFISNSQQLEDSKHKFSSEDFLKKSKKQKTRGFVLLGGGVAFFTGGVLAMGNSNSKGENEFPFIVGGMAMVVSSIPFFISSAINKHKAKLELKRNASVMIPGVDRKIHQTSLSLKIEL